MRAPRRAQFGYCLRRRWATSAATPCSTLTASGRRFYALREKAAVATQPDPLGKAPKDVSIYARTNLWMINTARVEAIDSAKIPAVLLWDEKPTGDGPGGTSDFESRVRSLGGLIEIINPMTLQTLP